MPTLFSRYRPSISKLISAILIQILPVMIGVYLGFALNNFGEEQKTKNKTEVYRSILAAEVNQNLAAIKEVKDYHIELSNRLNELLNSPKITDAFKTFRFNGIRPAKISRSAFDTGIQTGIMQEFKIPLIQELNSLYAYQQRLDDFNANMVNSLASQKFPETEKEIRNLATILSISLNDIKVYESRLESDYQSILQELQKKANDE